MESDPIKRAEALEAKQKACRDKMIAEGKHVFNPDKKVRSQDHHIADWVKPTIKAIRRQAKKRQVATVTPIKKTA